MYPLKISAIKEVSKTKGTDFMAQRKQWTAQKKLDIVLQGKGILIVADELKSQAMYAAT